MHNILVTCFQWCAFIELMGIYFNGTASSYVLVSFVSIKFSPLYSSFLHYYNVVVFYIFFIKYRVAKSDEFLVVLLCMFV